jgi:anti-sigma B factor antagonist
MRGGRFPIELVNGVPVVAAPEEIDITNAEELRAALLEAAAHGHATFVADLTQTQFCDSSGLHALLAAHKRAQAEGGEMLLVVCGTAVLRVFAITSVDHMIRNFRTLEEALAHSELRHRRSCPHPGAGFGPLPVATIASLTRSDAGELRAAHGGQGPLSACRHRF